MTKAKKFPAGDTKMQNAVTYEVVYLDTVKARDLRYGLITFRNPAHFWSEAKFPWGTMIEEHRFNFHTVSALSAILDQVEADLSLAGIIITGEGKYFSNGVDVEFVRSHLGSASTLQKQLELVMARVLSLGVVTVAVLNGHTTAAGAIFSLCCDYRIMSERGLFLLPAVALGIVYSQGFIEVVKHRVLDPSLLRDILLWSKRYSSSQLLDLRLIDRVLSGDAAMEEAISLIRKNLQEHSASLAEAKRRLYRSAIVALSDERVSEMHWDRLVAPRSKL